MNHNGFASIEFLHCGNRSLRLFPCLGFELKSGIYFLTVCLYATCARTYRQTQIEIAMNTVKKNQKNGTEKTAIPDVKAPIVKPEPEKQQSMVKPSLEERIQRVEELRSLTGKRHRTIETLNNLRTFNFGSDDSCTLAIHDSQGHKFQTGNSNLVSLLKEYLQARLNEKVSALDDEIMEFKL